MLGNIGPMQLLIIFLIVLLIFGTKKLRNVGGDLGSAIRDFRKGMSNNDEEEGEEEDGDEDAKKEVDARNKDGEDGKGADSGTEKPVSAKAFEADSEKQKS